MPPSGDGSGSIPNIDVDRFGDVITSCNCYNYDKTEKGRNCVHRAKFLDEMIQLVPDGVAEFNKRMVNMQQDAKGVYISFDDGTTVYASAVVACDGIKSLARKLVLGANSPDVAPVFAGEYAYRNLFPRAEADQILGSERAGNGSIYCGQDAYVVTYPVEHGRLMNMTAVRRKADLTWSDENWLAPTSRETMLEDFNGWGGPIQQLLSKIKDTSRWALFDAPDAKTYCSGRICLIGDAAHASTPNQGAGSGMAYEDAYILSVLLGEVKTSDQICKAFEAFDAVRRPRTQRLVATSRTAGALYEFAHEGIGDDLTKIKENVDTRHLWIWEVDLPGEVERAKRLMHSK
jgi:salicylate hydroxylase